MNTDRESLQRNLEDLRQKIDESKKVVLNLEVTLANRVTTVEEALDTYTGMLTTLSLYPTPPEPWQDIDLTLELNSGSSNAQQMLIGADIRKIIRPTLSSVADSKRQERAMIESESVNVNNELDQLTIECKNLDYDMSEIETKVVQLNEQADDLRDVRSFFPLRLISQPNSVFFTRLRNKRRSSPMPTHHDWNASSHKQRRRLSPTALGLNHVSRHCNSGIKQKSLEHGKSLAKDFSHSQ